MQLRTFLIEQYFREYDFRTEITLCSSGVQPYSLGEIRTLLGLQQEELDAILLRNAYSHGHPDLRRAIALRFGDGDPERILCTHGSSEALYLALTGLLKEGDEVVALYPSYQSHYSIPQDMGCKVRYWFLRGENGFVPEIASLASLLTPRPQAVIVNFPNNPTGATLSECDLRTLVDAVAETGAYLIWDDAFGSLVYEGAPLPDPSRWYRRTVSLRTLSKVYGLPGLRVGWCQAEPDIIEQFVRLRDYTTLNLSPLNEFIALRAIEQLDLLFRPRYEQACTNRGILSRWVCRHAECVEWTCPKGGVSAFIRLCGNDSKEFCRRLATERGVFLLPGDSFGYPEYIRIGFGGPTAELEVGLSRLTEMIGEAQATTRPRG